MSTTPPVLAVSNLKKSFSQDQHVHRVLCGISFSVELRRRLFITGPNGSGKSVLAKCVCGLLDSDDGVVAVDGGEIANACRQTMLWSGVDYVPQVLPAPDSITVAEFFGLRQKGTFFFSARRIMREMKDRSRDLSLDFAASGHEALSSLSRFQLLSLYILRAVSAGLRVLWLDEPTAAINRTEAYQLNAALERIRARGIALVLIAHPEQYGSFAEDGLGRDSDAYCLEDGILKRLTRLERPVYSFLRHIGRVEPPPKWRASLVPDGERSSRFDIGPGQIVAIIGPTSREFQDFAHSLSCRSDRLQLRDSPAFRNTIQVAYLPFAAKEMQLAPSLDALENSLIYRWQEREIRRFLFLIDRRRARRTIYDRLASVMALEPDDPHVEVRALSGGNQQRLVLGRTLTRNMDLFIACELCRGLDDPGIRLVTALLEQRAAQGLAAILLTTSPESVEAQLADRVFELLADGVLVARGASC